jgi:16S rRNA (guanine527-N7)-methyltransferase
MNDQELAWLTRQLAVWKLDLPAPVPEQLLSFLDELLRWNRRINLTAIRDRQEALEKHLLDSLSILPLLRGDERLLDLGSGAGLPGIPLKIASPCLQLWSVDAVQKKIAFQRQVGRLLSLNSFHPTQARVEDLAQDGKWQGRFEVVVARAVASLPTLVAWGLPLLQPAGRLIAMKGPEGEAELLAARAELRTLGVHCIEQLQFRLPASGAERRLLVLARF